MEEITIEELFEDFQIPQPSFVVIYHEDTKVVKGVGPADAYKNQNNKIDIDQETAEKFITGKLLMHKHIVNLETNKIELIQEQTLYKISNLLLRVPEKQWVKLDKIDLYITYNSKSKTLKFQLSEEFGGTKKLLKKHLPMKLQPVDSMQGMMLDFIITDYNDPNVVYKLVNFRFDDLVGKNKIVKDIELTKNQSIFTRRVFKSYVMEIK